MRGTDVQGIHTQSRAMKKKSNPACEHFKLLLFVLFLGELILFLIALIFGRLFGYRLTFATCFWFGVIVALCYAMILGANLGVIFFITLFNITYF